ncbi:MAG: UxaA family hydrolase [Pseudomonadota bacterium]
MSSDAIKLDASDHVATALRALAASQRAAVSGPGGRNHLVLSDAIPAFHKIALVDLPEGTPVRKYGAVIGTLSAPVSAGELVHVHNLKSLKGRHR